MSIRNQVAASFLVLTFAGCAAADEVEDQAPEQAEEQVELAGATQAELKTATTVGVLCGQAPDTAERVEIWLENENDDNNNYRKGYGVQVAWRFDINTSVGGHGVGTVISFCRVEGKKLHPIKSSSSDANFAVLQLGSECPAGSVPFVRYFDNEDYGFPPSSLHPVGDFSPSYYTSPNGDANFFMHFCLFRASTASTAVSAMPSLGFPYGVFASSDFPSNLVVNDSSHQSDEYGNEQYGDIRTDDEDDHNHDDVTGDYRGSEKIIEAEHGGDTPGNTHMHVARVK
jgi:hypothetical protein